MVGIKMLFDGISQSSFSPVGNYFYGIQQMLPFVNDIIKLQNT